MSERSCICIFSALYKPSMGGVELYTEHLASELVQKGYGVIVVTSNTHDLESKSMEGNVEILRLPCHALMGGRLPLPKKNALYKQLVRNLKERKIDHFLINSRFYPHSHEGVLIAEEMGIKPILLDHGSAYLTLGNPLADAVLRSYEHFMTDRIKRHDIDYYGVSEASVIWLKHFGIKAKGTLNNAIDAKSFLSHASKRNIKEELSMNKNAFVVAFTGRLVPEKGIDALIAAAERLRDHQEIQFVLAGDGPKRTEIERIGGNVHLLGKIPPEDIAALLLQADAFCLPTRSEGFSTSLLEAAICGCAPIITDVGGVSEMIPDESYGVILDDKDPTTIADHILYLCDHPDKCKEIAQNLRSRTAETFTWSRTANRLLEACAAAQDSV